MKQVTKKEVISSFARKSGDTGSPEVQIALLTMKIEKLKKHLELHAKDNHSRRGILLMVAKRRKLINYLKRVDSAAYTKVVQELEIRQ